MAFAPNYTNFRPTAAAAVRPVFNNPQVKSLASIMSTEAQETMSDTIERNQEIAYGLAKQTLAESGAIRRVEIQGENQRKLERLKQKSPIAKLTALANYRQASRSGGLSALSLSSVDSNELNKTSSGVPLAGQRLQSGLTNLNLVGDSSSSKTKQNEIIDDVINISEKGDEELSQILDVAAADDKPSALENLMASPNPITPLMLINSDVNMKDVMEEYKENNRKHVETGGWDVSGYTF